MDTLKTTKPQYTSSAQSSQTGETSSDAANEAAMLRAHQRQFVTEHSTCAMCDTRLEIRHEINRNDLKIKEEAHCPSCGIRVRSSHHLMQ
jgi:hypothetical protein